MTNEFHHVTVLLHETVDMLDIKPDGIYVDATLGGAGHSSYLLSQLSEKGHLYCFDHTENPETAEIKIEQVRRRIDASQCPVEGVIENRVFRRWSSVDWICENFKNKENYLF